MGRFKICFISLLLMQVLVSQGQTCCTGGTPLLGSYVFSAFNQGEVSIHSTFTHNANRDLISGDKKLNESFIQRRVNSIILQADYGISPQFLVSVVVPYLMQEEGVDQSAGTSNFTNNGLGDISVWLRYQLVKSNYEIGAAVGIKAPTGSTQATSANGILLPLSMQSGSGSFDVGVNLQSSVFLTSNRKWTYASQYAFLLNSKGRSFEAHPRYKFGNQYQTLQAIAMQNVLSSFVMQTYVGSVYQYRTMDRFDGGFENENTGGHWLNLAFGNSTSITQDLQVGLNLMLPLYRNINGLQLSTTWQGSIIISYKLSKRDGSDIFTID